MSNKLFIKTLAEAKFIFGLLSNDLEDFEEFVWKILRKIKASEKYVKTHEVLTP